MDAALTVIAMEKTVLQRVEDTMATNSKPDNITREPQPGKRGPKTGQPDFIRATELAFKLGYADTKTLYALVSEGKIPPPHDELSERATIWRRDFYEHYKEHGVWPAEAW